jgi:hypothetical protein
MANVNSQSQSARSRRVHESGVLIFSSRLTCGVWLVSDEPEMNQALGHLT